MRNFGATLCRRVWAKLLGFGEDCSGAVAIIGVAFVLAAVAATAIVTDWGIVYLAKRNQQGVTDLAALIAARNIGKAQAAANLTLTSNGIAPTGPVTVSLGSYMPDLSLSIDRRFVPGGTPVNAVRVRVPAEKSLHFGRVFMLRDSVPIVTEATAAVTEIAAFGIGSRLASLNRGIVNALLESLLGGNVALSAMDYDALADAHVDLFEFLDQVAVAADAEVGTYSELATSDISVGDVIEAMVAAGMNGPVSTEAVLSTLLNNTNAANVMLPAGKLVDLGSYAGLALGNASGMAADVNVFQLLNAATVVANGDRQVALDLGQSVPGLANLHLSLVIGEPMQGSSWFAIGGEGTTVYTAQTRLRLDATILGSGVIGAAPIRIPILVDVASARATLASISCGDNPATDGTVTLNVLPAAADVWIGEPDPPSGWTDFSAPPAVASAPILNVAGLARADGRAHIAIGNMTERPVSFTMPEIDNHTIKTVSTQTPITSLVASLLENTDITVTTLGLTLPAVGPLVRSLLATQLARVGPILDPVLMTVLEVLGVSIGEADVTVSGLRCDGSVLVN